MKNMVVSNLDLTMEETGHGSVMGWTFYKTDGSDGI